MKLYDYSVNDLLLRMLRNPTVSRQEIIDFVLKSDLVSQEKVVEFLKEYQAKYPIDWDAELKSDPIDPVYEEIVPSDWDQD